MRYREMPFTIYPRRRKHGWVWLYRTYGESGRRLPERSTGIGYSDERDRERTRRRAEAYCWKLHSADELIPKRYPTLREYAESRNWWVWGKCHYIEIRNERAPEGKLAVTPGYASNASQMLRDHILPYLGDLPLDRLDPEILERWMLDLTRAPKKLSNKRVNNVASVLRVMLREAKRLRVIPSNPFDDVHELGVARSETGVITLEEFRSVFDPRTWSDHWKEHVYYAASLTAAVTAMRQSEVIGVIAPNVHDTHIVVDKQWSNRLRERVATKGKSTRYVPIPAFVHRELAPHLEHGGFVFSFQSGDYPINQNRLAEAFYAALASAGISAEAREARRLKFHSLRHFANTYFRGAGVLDAKIRAVTEHSTAAMTDHYTHFSLEDYRDILEAQRSLGSWEGTTPDS